MYYDLNLKIQKKVEATTKNLFLLFHVDIVPCSPLLMASIEKQSWEDIVLDTSAFLQSEIEPLRSFSNRLWTLEEVLEEVKDKKSRANLEFSFISDLVKTRRPKNQSINAVIEFSKKTGDFAALSKTDILVIALAHEIRLESGHQFDLIPQSIQEFDEQDESKPHEANPENQQTSSAKSSSRQANAGISWASVIKNSNAINEVRDSEQINEKVLHQEINSLKITQSINPTVMWDDTDFEIEQNKPEVPPASFDTDLFPSLSSTIKAKEKKFHRPLPAPIFKPSTFPTSTSHTLKNSDEAQSINMEEQDHQLAEPRTNSVNHVHNPTESRILSLSGVTPIKANDGDIDDDDEGWAKPGSINDGWLKGSKNDKKKDIKTLPLCRVACVTTDYAVQNVLLQMKIGLVSLDGRRITQVKNWVLKCDGCLKTFPADDKRLFCPHCGNATLARLAYTVDVYGNRKYHYAKHRKFRTRGIRYPISKNANLLLREDQMLSGIWSQRANTNKKSVSMFGEDINAALDLDIKIQPSVKVGFGNQNPNSLKGRERRGSKKKQG